MNLALFDFDGTITSRDTFTSFLRYSASPARLLAGALLLTPVFVAYKSGLLPARRSRPVAARFALAGGKAETFRELGRAYAADVLPGLLRREAMTRIAWHQQQGDEVVVVSASLELYLRPWCRSMGVEVICTCLEERGGLFTGRYVEGDCAGPEKLRRIRHKYDLQRFPLVYAYGDTDEDREMLGVAHERYYRWERMRDGPVRRPAR